MQGREGWFIKFEHVINSCLPGETWPGRINNNHNLFSRTRKQPRKDCNDVSPTCSRFYGTCHRVVGGIDKRQMVGLGSHKGPGRQQAS